MISRGRMPQHYKRGIIVPIAKSNRDRTIKVNNRGITLLTVFYKIFDKIMLNREKQWFQRNEVIDELHRAGKSHCSCLHTSFLLQEAISYNLARGENVYVTFLDIRKAFDTVYIPGLLYKLYQNGLNMGIWRLISDSYHAFECSALIAGRPGPWFEPERGIHQGAPVSKPLCQIYVYDLLKQLRSHSHGAVIGKTDITSPTYVDDIAICSLYTTG